MGILSWLLGSDSARGAQHSHHMGETVERVLNLHPRLRLASRCQARLSPPLAVALKYVEDLIAAVPPPREASAAAWAVDPCIHAFFAGPDDVAHHVSRSADLRAYFNANPDVQEAYAILGMAMKERRILGVALEGGSLRRDVAQTTVSFSDHQVRICARTDAELREEIVRRLVDQLALEGLARIAADQTRRDLLEQERALLKTRLQLLERQGAGIRSVLGDETAISSEEHAQLQQQLAENGANLSGLGLKTEALDNELDRMCDVFSDPQPHIDITSKCLYLDRMNVILDKSNQLDGEEITFPVARIPTRPPQIRAFSLVRFARSDLLPEVSMFETAARLLS
jgi:hypothetical protein